MMRFLRENAEVITSICVVLSLLLGGTLLYLKHRAEAPAVVDVQTAPIAPVPPAPTPVPAPDATTARPAEDK